MYEISARKIWKEKIKSMVYNETLLPKEDVIMKKNFISRIAPYIRKYDLDIIGRENIPYNSVLFICNHSNSHDFFTIQEVWNDLKSQLLLLVPMIVLIYFPHCYLKQEMSL